MVMAGTKAPSALTSFGSPGDPGIEPQLRILANIGFVTPATKAELAAKEVILAKLRTLDPNSIEGKQIVEQVCKHLRPGQEPSLFLAHNALLDIQGSTIKSQAAFPYKDTNFAQIAIRGVIDNLNKNAPQKVLR